MILAGDIGGTNTRLALFEKVGQDFVSLAEARFQSAAHAGFVEILEKFLSGRAKDFESVCFGVAAPVRSEVIKVTNLPWTVDAGAIKRFLDCGKVDLINDLEANAYGLNELKAEDFAVLSDGAKDAAGNAAIIAAGTGLGEAGLYFDRENGHFKPFATEGGHTDFAPRDELEIELLRYLLTKFNHVSAERVVSGMGLTNIFEFMRDAKREPVPARLSDEIENSGDAGAVITANALAGQSAICERTLDVFVSLYGAEAGNLALKTMATGGVFLGGGIAPKILPKLREGAFLESFFAKGRMRRLLEAVPVRVILNESAALLGAARYALL